MRLIIIEYTIFNVLDVFIFHLTIYHIQVLLMIVTVLTCFKNSEERADFWRAKLLINKGQAAVFILLADALPESMESY